MPRRNLVVSVAILFASLLLRIGNAQPDLSNQILKSGPVEVRLRVEPTRTNTAGKIAVELEITAPSALRVEIADPTPPRGRLTAVAEMASGPVTLLPGVMEYRRHVVYRPFLAGKYEVPPFTISYGGDRSDWIVTKPVPLVVTSVVEGDPASAVPAGILPVEPAADALPATAARWWLATIMIVVALAGGWFAWRKRRQPLPAPPPVEPAAAALAAIESLPIQDLRGLERAIERWRARQRDTLPGVLDAAYQWIRFGSPTPSDVERFRGSLRAHLRNQGREPAKGPR